MYFLMLNEDKYLISSFKFFDSSFPKQPKINVNKNIASDSDKPHFER